jgi:hypothetical protein
MVRAVSQAAHICPECGERADAPGRCAKDGQTLEPVGDDPLVGTAIGRFTITGLIGQGGAGRVYRAVQRDIGGRVAIKVLSRQAGEDREAVARFFAEARAVNLIRHEGIVQVLDLAALDDGRPYIVMEHLEGASLAECIARAGAVDAVGVARWADEVLAALAAAHERGIVHRDLKPANLWVTPAGHAKILDFGLAKLAPELDARGLSTRSGLLLGTPHYMSPEQADARAVDARADLYSLGVALYEAVTGTRPFDAASLYELLRQHLEDVPEAPSKRRPDLPPSLDRVIRKALEKDPARRYQSAGEMRHALHSAIAGLSAPSLSPAGGRARSDAHGSLETASTVVTDRRLAPTPQATTIGREAPPASLPWRPIAVIAAIVALLGVAVVLIGDKRGATPGSPAAALAGADAAPAKGPLQEARAALADAGPGPIDGGALAAALPDAAARVTVPAAPTRTYPPGRSADAGPKGHAVAVVTKAADAGAVSVGPGAGPPEIVEPPRSDVERWRDGEERRIPSPADPSRFDLVAAIPAMTNLAREVFPDAELVMMYATWIRADGIMDMTEKGSAGFLFRTPSLAGQDARCYLTIEQHARGGSLRATLPVNPGDRCTWPVAPKPSCSPGEVWKTAAQKGAPTDGRAYMRYLVRKGQGVWEFALMGGGLAFTAADQCP